MKHRKPNRLPEYDYSNPQWYFITICIKDHKPMLGELKNEKMHLTRIGKIVDECWNKIQTVHNHVELDDYIVMPNHIHGIIIIKKYIVGDAKSCPTRRVASPTTTPSPSITNHTDDRTKMELCKLIQQFKRAVTLKVRAINPDFAWQRSFYDRVIRDEKELHNIRKYIFLNPLKWDLGKDVENLQI